MLTDVWTKFRLFQKPANFDGRLAECERVLAGVKAQVGLLEVGSVEHDVVQSQLEQCMVGQIPSGNMYCNSYTARSFSHSKSYHQEALLRGGYDVLIPVFRRSNRV